MNEQLWWYVARASGMVAWALLAASIVWGLLVATRLLGRRPSPGWLLDLHRALGGLAVIFTGVHLVGLWADSYVHFGPAELFVPLTSHWRPGAVAWGVVAFYGLLAVELTSLGMRKLPRAVWSWIHRGSVVLFLMATAHGLAAGTDLRSPMMRAAFLMSVPLVLFLFLVRRLAARRARPRPSREPTADRPRVPAGTGAAQ